ncbi:MAG: hypothetical protein KO202_04815 [Methanobacteriaceae archaeon]|jgi:transposase-like protein|nr:hypothetical protein [Methanobacteriaceae archaeon]
MTPKTIEKQTISVPDEQYLINLFKKIRWSDGIYCTKCHSFNIEKRGPQGRIHRYHCNECNNYFNDFTNTPFHKSQIEMGTMLYILFNSEHKNITTLSKETGLTRQAIYRIKQKFEKL